MEMLPASASNYDETTLCNHCEGLFSHPDIVQTLASTVGLRYRRKRSSMALAALEGCLLCRELLCMPYLTTDGVIGGVRTYSARNWPAYVWSDLTRKHRAGSLSGMFKGSLAQLRDPQFHFQWTGDLNSSFFIEVARDQTGHKQKRLLFEVSAIPLTSTPCGTKPGKRSCLLLLLT
jgi:hypothetical protein